MSEKDKKKPQKNFLGYSALAGQMLVIIVVGVYGGLKLDSWVDVGFPVFTLLLSLVSVAFAIYYAIKDFL